MVPKYVSISDILRKRIRSGYYDQTGLLPTEYLLMQEFQVSRQTVRQALSVLVGEGAIAKRQGSGSYITELGRNPNTQEKNVAVIATYISDYIFPRILRSVQDFFARNNCSIRLYATQNNVVLERQVLETLLQNPVDGILIEGTKTALPNPNIDLYLRLKESNIPVVFFNGCYHGSGCDQEPPDFLSVTDDNFNGGYQLVDYLIRSGHTHIAGIFKSDDIQGVERYRGYITALRDLGALRENSAVFWYTTESLDVMLSMPLLAHLEGYSAIVCYNDSVAYRLIELLNGSGYRVPQDISIVSFDDSYYSELGTVKITTLSHGEQNTGYLAAQKLLALMDPSTDPAGIQSEVIPWTLKIKGSSRPVET